MEAGPSGLAAGSIAEEVVDMEKHPSGIIPKLQNMVATVNLGCKLDLKQIALHARNSEYNPKVKHYLFFCVLQSLCIRFEEIPYLRMYNVISEWLRFLGKDSDKTGRASHAALDPIHTGDVNVQSLTVSCTIWWALLSVTILDKDIVSGSMPIYTDHHLTFSPANGCCKSISSNIYFSLLASLKTPLYLLEYWDHSRLLGSFNFSCNIS